MTQKFFITGSGTSVGKTLVTASLAYQLRISGKRVSALKPVISGYADVTAESDTALLLQSLGQAVNPVTVEAVSPWRFKAELAPNMAATKEGRGIEFLDVMAFCNMPRTSEITLIESAGGVMSPLTNTHTMLDWVEALECPAVVVVGTYLGAISHALTSCEVLRARGVVVQAVVVSESTQGAMSVDKTALMMKTFLPYAHYVVPLPRVVGGDNIWQHTADLTWMLT